MDTSANFDALGAAVAAYYAGDKDAVIRVISSITEDDVIPAAYLFRDFADMPEAEQLALKEAKGRVLDIGAGAGTHALWLQEQGLPVVALEISETACKIMQQRGVQNIANADLWQYEPEAEFDTILLLMNGLGLAGTMDKLPTFLDKLKGWLKPGGRVLVESSDIWYMYEEEDGSVSFDLNAAYYGEITYQMAFGGKAGKPFPWLFLDPVLLQDYAENAGFKVSYLHEGDNFQYLAALEKK